MFDSIYDYSVIHKGSSITEQYDNVVLYKFSSRHRDYIVSLETYALGFVAIKFCERQDFRLKNAKRYERTFNDIDNDATRIISTCLHIMRDFWVLHPGTNFCFHGTLRPLNSNDTNIRKNRTVRFNIYRYAMFNLFSPHDFEHYFDTDNCVYLLLNKTEQQPENVVKGLTKFLSDNYNIIFDTANAVNE